MTDPQIYIDDETRRRMNLVHLVWISNPQGTRGGPVPAERRPFSRRKHHHRQAKDQVIDWLLWYNRIRLHSTLAYVSPMKFEQDWLANQPRQVNS